MCVLTACRASQKIIEVQEAGTFESDESDESDDNEVPPSPPTQLLERGRQKHRKSPPNKKQRKSSAAPNRSPENRSMSM